MASGRTLSGGGVKAFHDMKVCKSSVPEKVTFREPVPFCLREDKKNTVLQEGKGILADMGQM